MEDHQGESKQRAGCGNVTVAILCVGIVTFAVIGFAAQLFPPGTFFQSFHVVRAEDPAADSNLAATISRILFRVLLACGLIAAVWGLLALRRDDRMNDSDDRANP